jgi:hypothetical protein
MGLLDIFNTGDPQKDAAISRGLLQAGLQLMQSKGKFLPALSQGGMAGLGGYEHEVNRQLAAKRIGLQDQYLSNQVDQQKREAALANLPGQFYNSGQGVDATGGMDTATSNPNNIGQASFDMPGYVKALYGKNPVAALQLQQSLQKPEVKLDTLAPGAKAGYFKNGVWTEVATNPKTDDDKESPVARLIKERDKFPIGDPTRRIFDDAIKKASTHQEPVSINNYGTPLPINLPGGGTGYLAPPARPGAPSQVLTIPGTNQPATKPGEEKPPTESERTAGFLLQRIRDSQRQLAGVIGKNPTAASPTVAAEGARLIGEPVANAMTADDRQKVEAAQLDILDAALTLGTGAAYTREQLLGYRKSYFPQLGDKPGVIKEKQDRLNNLIRAAETKAGKAAADKGSARTVKRTGTSNGRKVVEYSDGSIEYAD